MNFIFKSIYKIIRNRFWDLLELKESYIYQLWRFTNINIFCLRNLCKCIISDFINYSLDNEDKEEEEKLIELNLENLVDKTNKLIVLSFKSSLKLFIDKSSEIKIFLNPIFFLIIFIIFFECVAVLFLSIFE